MAEQKQYVILPEAPKPGEKLPEVINNPDIEHQWAVTASMVLIFFFFFLITLLHLIKAC